MVARAAQNMLSWCGCIIDRWSSISYDQESRTIAKLTWSSAHQAIRTQQRNLLLQLKWRPTYLIGRYRHSARNLSTADIQLFYNMYPELVTKTLMLSSPVHLKLGMVEILWYDNVNTRPLSFDKLQFCRAPCDETQEQTFRRFIPYMVTGYWLRGYEWCDRPMIKAYVLWNRLFRISCVAIVLLPRSQAGAVVVV